MVRYIIAMKINAMKFVLAAFCATAASAVALTICPACGYEAEDGATRCEHCNALLPATEQPVTTTEATAQESVQDSGATNAELADMAFEAAREDAVFAKKEEAKNPALALQAYENALALLALAKGDARAAKAGQAIADSILQCREAIMVGSRPCAACNGSGKRSFTAHNMGGEDVTREVSGSVCTACNGRGKVRAMRGADELAGLVNKCDHEYGIMKQGAGRVPCGRVWIPAEWKLSNEDTALVRRSRPRTCKDCGGFHDIDCRDCKGLGLVQCKAKGCKNGQVEQKNANSLSPKTEIATHSPCAVCKGAGRTACVTCKGDGRVTCPACSGTGIAGTCRTCGGEGVITCKGCGGEGIDKKGEKCRLCDGEGRQLCNSCNGDGHQAK